MTTDNLWTKLEVEQVLEQLPEVERQLVLWRWHEDLTFREIAAQGLVRWQDARRKRLVLGGNGPKPSERTLYGRVHTALAPWRWRRLFEEFEPAIRGIAHKLAGRNATLCEDLVQEGALVLRELKLDGLNGKRGAFVRQAVKYHMLDVLRREQRQNRPEALEDQTALL